MQSYDYDQPPTNVSVAMLEDAAALTGLDPEDILSLLDSGLEMDHLILYVNATVANRMN